MQMAEQVQLSKIMLRFFGCSPISYLNFKFSERLLFLCIFFGVCPVVFMCTEVVLRDKAPVVEIRHRDQSWRVTEQ